MSAAFALDLEVAAVHIGARGVVRDYRYLTYESNFAGLCPPKNLAASISVECLSPSSDFLAARRSVASLVHSYQMFSVQQLQYKHWKYGGAGTDAPRRFPVLLVPGRHNR